LTNIGHKTAKVNVALNSPGESKFNKTSLDAAGYGYIVHRDYAAHFFRWGFIGRVIKGGQTRVLDVGCGPDVPLVRVMTNPRSVVPQSYVGVDLRNIKEPPKRTWSTVIGKFNFLERFRELGQFDLVVSLETIEHMDYDDGHKMLLGIKECVAPGGKFILSTPIFNGRAARNHIHEYRADELQELLEKSGFRVEKRFGTFASVNDIRKAATPEHLAVYEELRQYYSDDVCACFLAPFYPDASRNNLWICEVA
jgi:SAM-dependent methyltransferase